MLTNNHAFRRRARRVSAAVALASVQLLQGCKGVLDVKLPGTVPESALDNAALAGTLVSSAQADFECAFTEFVHTTGLWSNEVMNSSGHVEVTGWGARIPSYEAGTLPCQTVSSGLSNYGTYLPMQVARGQAENALKHLDGLTDAQVANRTLLTATAATYAGFSYTLLGEAYCQMAVDAGPLITRAATLALAETRFTRAIDLATKANDSRILNAALVGRARVRLDLGNKTGAAADAKLVTTNFVFNATYSNSAVRRNNTTYVNQNVNFNESVDPAFRNLTVGGVPDPRVPVKNMNRLGQDAFTPLWIQQRYTAVETPIPIATWDEAQLIIAEAEGGQSAVAAINRIRTKYNLPQYAGGTAAEIQAQLIEDRRRTLYLDGHSLGDHLRLNLPFPTGLNHKGQRYGDQTCLPLPPSEMNGRA